MADYNWDELIQNKEVIQRISYLLVEQAVSHGGADEKLFSAAIFVFDIIKSFCDGYPEEEFMKRWVDLRAEAAENLDDEELLYSFDVPNLESHSDYLDGYEDVGMGAIVFETVLDIFDIMPPQYWRLVPPAVASGFCA